MDKLEVQMKKLKKMQKEGKKQAERVNSLVRKQLQDVEIIDQVTQFAQKSINDVKKASLKDRVCDNLKKWRKVGIVLAVLIGVGILVNALFRRYKTNKQNFEDDSRFDFIDEVTERADDTFDFDNASLEELEEALLRVENDLNEVTEALGGNE